MGSYSVSRLIVLMFNAARQLSLGRTINIESRNPMKQSHANVIEKRDLKNKLSAYQPTLIGIPP